MACEYCGWEFGHHFQCPNYIPPRPQHYCAVCGEAIQNGEEYIKNDDNEYAHWDCVWYGRELVKFLGYEIKEMEETDDQQTEDMV